MLAPDPRLARKVSRGVSSLSQSAAKGVSSSSSKLPVRRRVADLSFGRGGFVRICIVSILRFFVIDPFMIVFPTVFISYLSDNLSFVQIKSLSLMY